MAVLMLSVLAPLMEQLRLTEPQLIAMADEPGTVAGLIRRQRELDRIQLDINHVAAIDPAQTNPALRRRELRLGRTQNTALRRYLTAPMQDPTAAIVRLLILVATLEPGLTASALRDIILTIGLPQSMK